mmetsp:Transcript_4486/g.9744  ORF Transcript_4486/g.9744 Transcript_4486/m.9744 type:complete len:135 (+) Transcript_4486:276-680(+)
MIGISDWQKEDAAGDGTGTARPGSPASLHSRLRRRMDGPVSELGPMKILNLQETSRLLMDCYHGEDMSFPNTRLMQPRAICSCLLVGSTLSTQQKESSRRGPWTVKACPLRRRQIVVILAAKRIEELGAKCLEH